MHQIVGCAEITISRNNTCVGQLSAICACVERIGTVDIGECVEPIGTVDVGVCVYVVRGEHNYVCIL